jgi:hypothetical protein
MACFQGSNLEIQGLLAAEFVRNKYYSGVSISRPYNPVTLCRDLRITEVDIVSVRRTTTQETKVESMASG